MRMYVYASRNGGYDMYGNLYNGLWCHTTPYIVSQTLDADREKAATEEERAAKSEEAKDIIAETYGYTKDDNGDLIAGDNADTKGYENFTKGFESPRNAFRFHDKFAG